MTVPADTDFYTLLRQKGLLTDSPTAVPTYDGPAAPPGDPRARRYAEAALERECDRVSHAVSGTRNSVLSDACGRIGMFVGAGHLSPAEAIDALTEAAKVTKLPQGEISRVVTRRVKDGAKTPRTVTLTEPEPIPAAFAIDPTRRPGEADETTSPFVPGGTFILDVPDEVPAVWGHDQEVLWASGESLIIAAGNGLGKTTIAGQLVRGRLGLSPAVLGMPIAAGRKRVLYLAMDRPQQIRRSLRRHFTEPERATLDDRLSVWQGPPPQDLAQQPDLLLGMVLKADADTVVIDSLKDAAVGLSDDAVGAGWNRARQKVIAAGCQVLELHHNVKRSPNGADPSTISDIYGSAWITAGVGSAILLTGSPGDPVVHMRHVKQPADEVGPWQLLHDHDAGVTTVYEPVDLVEWVRIHDLCTAKDAAVTLFEKENPTAAEKEKARRKLERLVKSGHLTVVRGTSGGRNGGVPDRYQTTVAASVWDES